MTAISWAITRCLVELGLRACDTARISLDGIDWRHRIVTLEPGKNRRQLRLPITDQLFDALVDYVKNGRPTTIERTLKERVIPLWPKTISRLKAWLLKIPSREDGPLFPMNRFGELLTRSGVRQRLLIAQQRAMKHCPSLSTRKITPHTLRHTTAMHLLQSGVDLSVIALWLGHEQIETTHQYMEVNLDMKKDALKSLDPVESGAVKRFKKPSDSVLAFLESL